jgi:hypothetical protein
MSAIQRPSTSRSSSTIRRMSRGYPIHSQGDAPGLRKNEPSALQRRRRFEAQRAALLEPRARPWVGRRHSATIFVSPRLPFRERSSTLQAPVLLPLTQAASRTQATPISGGGGPQNRALAIWKEKLDFLEEQAALVVDASQGPRAWRPLEVEEVDRFGRRVPRRRGTGDLACPVYNKFVVQQTCCATDRRRLAGGLVLGQVELVVEGHLALGGGCVACFLA